MANSKEYEYANALPNKFLNPDGTNSTITGEPIINPVDAYRLAKSIPNKFLNPDGTYSTLEELGIGGNVELFIVVDELPAEGEPNKIYLVPNPSGDGTFIEYHYHNNRWDPIGILEIDLSNYPTFDDMTLAINNALAAFVPLRSFPSSVVTNGTTTQFFNSIRSLNLNVGTMLLGGASLSDAPSGLVNEEIKVEVYPNNVFHAVMTSTNVQPYEWTIQYWQGTEQWIPRVQAETILDEAMAYTDAQIGEALGGDY